MRAGIIQSSFIPWRGYFDIIASVDAFVFLDDVQYTPRDWRNRNKIKTAQGALWLTVPVCHASQSQRICDTRIDESTLWRKKHLGSWQVNYQQAPFFEDILAIIEDTETGIDTISQLNIKLIKRICGYLGIATPLITSVELNQPGVKTERLINLVRSLGADRYLSGPSADAYLDKAAFKKAGIRLEYKTYDYKPYPQLFGAFDGAVSVLDLIANCGPKSIDFIKSRTPDFCIT